MILRKLTKTLAATTAAVLCISLCSCTNGEEKNSAKTTAATQAQTQSAAMKTQAQPVGVTAKFEVKNSWEENNFNCYQYLVTVTNNDDNAKDGWEVKASVPTDCEMKDKWGCESKLDNGTLTLTPVDYTAKLKAKESTSNLGFIIKSKSKMSNFYSINAPTAATAAISQTNVQPNTQSNEQTKAQAQAQNEAKTPVGSQKSNKNSASGNSKNSPAKQQPKKNSGGASKKPSGSTPLAAHGKLSLKGTNIVDKNGSKFQLKGVSTHGIAWFPQYVNESAFKTLRDSWGANMVRIAMYSAEYNGYCTGGNKSELESLVEKGVNSCTKLGMYAIIDWHVLGDKNPNVYKSQAISFFKKMAQKYKGNSNVIYEICNEPNGGTSWNEIKKYADDVIGTIRKYDSDALIIVGTPTWSQDVDQVHSNPVKNGKNVLYAVHFYAATHKQNIRDKVTSALKSGTPVFISEFSICDASGNGGIDYKEANKWKSLINNNNLSYAGWSLSNKAETSALIKSSCGKTSGWSDSDLSDTGKWLKKMIRG